MRGYPGRAAVDGAGIAVVERVAVEVDVLGGAGAVAHDLLAITAGLQGDR